MPHQCQSKWTARPGFVPDGSSSTARAKGLKCGGEIGQPLTLDLGNNVSVWARKLVGTTRTQYISRCSEANKTGDDAIVTADGRLLIENLTNEDVGVYFSPEEKPHIFRTKTGYYVMPPNVIQVLTRSSKRTQTP
ncbi:unnamed protein product [Toxocara canis]|uniref:Bulb-type lectin domain-containing protein n=1 Tax=Toxocara canis TaxID=6265 RepID=A0A183UY66_TOXCA|nr:unnamed protein product [Toxocara canis]